MRLISTLRSTLLFLLTILILSSCNSDRPTEREIHLENNSYQYDILESGVSLSIPDEFVNMSIPEFMSTIENSDLTPDIKTAQFGILTNISTKFENAEIFLDTLTNENLLWIIRSGPHVPIMNNSDNIMARMFLENNNTNNSTVQHEEIIEKDIESQRWYKYVKLRTRQKYFDKKRYASFYLVSTQRKSMGICFLSIIDHDYREVVDNIKRLE